MAPKAAERPESTARRILRETGLDGAVPVDIHAIAHKLGIVVLEDEQLETQLSGMLIRDNGKGAVIVVRKGDPPRRKRFTVAHELGHHQLHVGRPLLLEPSGSKFRLNERRTGGEVPSPREETQANRFAAEILMPQPLIENYFDRLAATHRSGDALAKALADRFEVSPIAMEFRLSNLGLFYPG